MDSRHSRADTYVLNVVLNDYEALDTVRKEACDWARQEGASLTPEEATAALLRLIEAGLVDGFRFDAAKNKFIAHRPGGLAELEGLWFMATPKGMEAADVA